MANPPAHAWNLTPAEARALQADLAGRVRLADDFGEVATIAGIDAGFEEKERPAIGGPFRSRVGNAL